MAGCGQKARGFHGYAFVANSEGRSIAAVDLSAFALAKQIPLDARPGEVIGHPAKPAVYALTPETGTIYEIDAATLAVRQHARPAQSAIGMRLAGDGQSLWMLAREPRALLRLPLETLRAAQRIQLPHEPGDFELGRRPEGLVAAVSFPGEGAVALCDLDGAGSVTATVPVGADPRLAGFRKDGKHLLVGNGADRLMTIVDVASGKIVVRLPLPVEPAHFCFLPDGGQLFVTGPGRDAVVIVEPYGTQVGETMLAGSAPANLSAYVTAKNSYLFACNPEAGDVTIIDLDTRKLVVMVHVGVEPRQVLFTPDNQYALVLNSGSGDMAVIRIRQFTSGPGAGWALKYKSSGVFLMVPVGARPVRAGGGGGGGCEADWPRRAQESPCRSHGKAIFSASHLGEDLYGCRFSSELQDPTISPSPAGKRDFSRISSRTAAASSPRTVQFPMMRLAPSDDPGSPEIISTAPSRRALIATAGGLAASAAALYLGMKLGRTPQPAFRRLTVRRGVVNMGRFAPDRRTIFYSASWDGGPSRVFSTLAGGNLDIPPAVLASISRQGELAVILEGSSNLARVSPGGGLPREVVRNVIAADWGPDGATFMIVRVAGSKQRIEFPIGKVIYETGNSISMARVSPDGRHVAFYENLAEGTLVNLNVIDPGGAARTLLAHWRDGAGLAWPPNGKEIWFSSTDDNDAPAIRAVDLSGKLRPILQLTQAAVVTDVSADGRVLFSGHDRRAHMMCQRPGETTERDLSWGDHSIATDISADGSTILFSETHMVELALRGVSVVYTRKTDGSRPEWFGEGRPFGLSPDANYCAILDPAKPHELTLDRQISKQMLVKADHFTYAGARWFPDGKRLLVWGNEDGHMRRHYVQEVGGPPRAITPEGSAEEAAIAPDGQDVAAHSGPGIFLFPVDGGQPELVRGTHGDARPVAWSDDGRSLYLRRGSVVELVDWKTGKGEVWKDLMPADPAGVAHIGRLSMTPDGRAYVYSYERDLSDLYLAEGLR